MGETVGMRGGREMASNRGQLGVGLRQEREREREFIGDGSIRLGGRWAWKSMTIALSDDLIHCPLLSSRSAQHDTGIFLFRPSGTGWDFLQGLFASASHEIWDFGLSSTVSTASAAADGFVHRLVVYTANYSKEVSKAGNHAEYKNNPAANNDKLVVFCWV